MNLIQRGNRLNTFAQLMRLDKPIGTWLLLWPCWWGVALASNGIPDLKLLVLFAIGALLMRSAGCIVNDMADREFDRQVARTRSRPLASGVISMKEAAALLGVLLLISLLIALQMHPHVLYWAVGSLFFVAAYPFMKRITYWPQAFLGLTFNLGALFGPVAVDGSPDLSAWILYLGGVFWTLGYDTIYGHQDIEDDLKIGVKSTSIRFGERTRLAVSICYGLFVFCLLTIGMLNQYSLLYYLLIACTAAHFIWQIRATHIDNPASCLRVFKSNRHVGAIIFLATLLSH